MGAMNNITPNLFQRAFTATIELWSLCMDMQGGHVKLS